MLAACKESSDVVEEKPLGSVQFGLGSSAIDGRTTGDNEPSFVLLSIENSSGDIIYEKVKIELFLFNGSYLSESLSLPEGDYQLTEFFVLNDLEEVLYATPVEGSELAEFVDNPLPIDFSIEAGSLATIQPEVISVEERLPSDFGYITFGFDVITVFEKTFGALIQSATGLELTTAALNIMGGRFDENNGEFITEWEKDILLSDEDSENAVLIKGGLERYAFTFEKTGYETYVSTYALEDLENIEAYYVELYPMPLEVIVEVDIDSSVEVDSVVITLYQEDIEIERRLEFSGPVASASFNVIPGNWDVNMIIYEQSGYFLYPGQQEAGYITHQVFEADQSVSITSGATFRFNGPGSTSNLSWAPRFIEEHERTGINYTFSQEMCDPYAAIDLNGYVLQDGHIDLFAWDKGSGGMEWYSYYSCIDSENSLTSFCGYSSHDDLFQSILNPSAPWGMFPVDYCESATEKIIDSIVILYIGDELGDLLVFGYQFDNGPIGEVEMNTPLVADFKETLKNKRSILRN